MQNNSLETGNYIEIPDDTLLVCSSNTEGVISYCSTDFISLFGYKESELIGKDYSILRHRDMPAVIYKRLWETVQSNREFNGYLLNQAKDGNGCWSFINITPTYGEQNVLTGFYTVYRKPEPDQLEYIKNLYTELKAIEDDSSSTDKVSESQFKLDSILNGKEVGYDEFILTI